MIPTRIEDTAEVKAQREYERIYYNLIGNMNRKERRTAHGQLLVAEAQNKALLAKIAVLEEELKATKGY